MLLTVTSMLEPVFLTKRDQNRGFKSGSLQPRASVGTHANARTVLADRVVCEACLCSKLSKRATQIVIKK